LFPPLNDSGRGKVRLAAMQFFTALAAIYGDSKNIDTDDMGDD